jgi:hypothetical protein
MRIERPDFALDLPTGFKVTSAAAEPSVTAVREADTLELYANGGLTFAPGEKPEVQLRWLVEKHQEVLQRDDPKQRVLHFEITERPDAWIAQYCAVGETPLMTLHAFVMRKELVVGWHPVASLSLFQHAFGPRVKDGDTFLRIFGLVLATYVVSPHADTIERAVSAPEGPSVLDRVYPYIVPPQYMEGRAVGAPAPRALGHDVFLNFAVDHGGAARVFLIEDRDDLGDARLVLAHAKANVARAVKARDIPVLLSEGPRGWPILVFGPDWRAASCLFMPGLASFASANLHAERVCASIPHRDTLLVFREGDAKYRNEMRAFVAEKESDGRKPLTRGLFRVSDMGPAALIE